MLLLFFFLTLCRECTLRQTQTYRESSKGDTRDLTLYSVFTVKKQINSNQINFIYIAQNHNHIASVGFTICTVNNILSLDPRFEWGKTSHVDGKKKPFHQKAFIRPLNLSNDMTEQVFCLLPSRQWLRVWHTACHFGPQGFYTEPWPCLMNEMPKSQNRGGAGREGDSKKDRSPFSSWD